MKSSVLFVFFLIVALSIRACKTSDSPPPTSSSSKETPAPVISSVCKNKPTIRQVISFTYEEPSNVMATIPLDVVKTLSPEEVTITLFCGFLENYRSPQIDITEKLDDYQIDDVQLYTYQNPEISNNLAAMIIFSIYPTRRETGYWVAGNGLISDDGWIRRKSLFMDVFIDDNTYIMANPHTGP